MALVLLHATGWLLDAACAGYLMAALAAVLGFRREEPGEREAAQPVPCVTVLRPLCGAEPGLELGLDSLLSQDVGDAQVRFVLGVASIQDAALPAARAAAARHPDRRARIVVDPRIHGANPKVSNLINMAEGGLDALVVVTDSDVILPPGALLGLIRAAQPAGVGAATALSRGRPCERGSWPQRMGALYLDGWFLPTALLHARIAPAAVCYGQLTAFKRDILPGGSFAALADVLADDTELGHLARRAGRSIVFAPHVVDVCVVDPTARALFSHELRWAKTIRALQPLGYTASIVMHPGPLPLLFAALQPGESGWLAALALVGLRWALVTLAHARFGRAPGLCAADPVTLWVREQLYFAVWTAGFFGRRIRWRGQALWIGPQATVGVAACAAAPAVRLGGARPPA